MSDDQDHPADGPHLTARGAEAKAERQRRQAEAMRANLRRRKLQARAREVPAESPAGDTERAIAGLEHEDAG